MSSVRRSAPVKRDLEQQQSTTLLSSTPDDTKFGIRLEKQSSISTNPSDLSSVPEISRSFCSYGVDWSNYAQPASHCWWPYSSKNSSKSHLCAHISCKKDKSIASSLVQCAACSLIIHTDHLVDPQITKDVDNFIVECRSSFTDTNARDHISLHDRHQWSVGISKRSQPCDYCKRKISSNIPDNDEHRLLSGCTCLWCARSYHRPCWEKMKEEDEESKCDYGLLGEIVVRPHWLYRVPDSPVGFRAQMSDHSLPITPVIFFINKISGGQKGEQIYRQLIRLLNPRQVFLLENDETIERALHIYSSLVNTRICICGGDGTVGWVLTRLVEFYPLLKNPPASICPLGTGNDLSRVLGWGYQYNSKRFRKMLTQIPRAQPVALDRWQIQIQALDITATIRDNENTRRCLCFMGNHPKFIRDANQPFYENHRTPTKMHFYNYMSFGLDAAVVLDFHARRTADSTKFTSPFKNKLLYLNEARKYFNEFAFGMRWNLGPYIRLICDGRDLTDSIRSCHTLVLLNITSFGSGTRPWNSLLANISRSPPNIQNDGGDALETNASFRTEITSTNVNSETLDRFEAQDFGDGKIEVLGLSSTQMAFIHLGFQGNRIAQCRHIRIELTHPMPVHMDGDPFYLPASISLDVKHAGQVMVLRK